MLRKRACDPIIPLSWEVAQRAGYTKPQTNEFRNSTAVQGIAAPGEDGTGSRAQALQKNREEIVERVVTGNRPMILDTVANRTLTDLRSESCH